ncbi:YicC/YloC family endoribonuclease [Sideroxydans lithotrophicus]|uniref:YicC domain protein n=1 Tax=Sideroxydans lithotrophicus (strain ES-1) TaxID=580332 RepID=D5CM28_SIDLE|nr:YicC/YloC family endoribonuclease [Sideroxydans lithotrophicus]ADE10642.1 YicC domain protein [Sideroxydans lithotrophicus ES-1]
MIYSMTGFAAVSTELDSGSLTLELRSVNHRYLDLQLRMPDELRTLEPILREAISAQISRGKAECRINLASRHSAQQPARMNQVLLEQLSAWSAQVREMLPDARELSVADVLRWDGVLESPALSAETLHDNLHALLQKALQDFAAARQREGEKLKSFLLERVVQIETLRAAVAPRIPSAITAYEAKLRTRLLEALGSDDDERVRQEITLYASKIDVDEELSRLQTHLAEVRRVLDKGGAVGKRLDFLMQELHREANTLGSKSVDAEVSRAAMDIKILIEQMREQVQNIE